MQTTVVPGPAHQPDFALRRGDVGPRVAVLREQLARASGRGDGDDGPAAAEASAEDFDATLDAAVRAFQQHRGLRVDGVVGPQTSRSLDGARWRLGDRVLRHVPGHLVHGDDVADLQGRLIALGVLDDRSDGHFGARTEAGVRELQHSTGLVVDGTVGPDTLAALRQIRRAVGGGDPSALREAARVHEARRRPHARVVVVDPGHGGADRGCEGGGLSEAVVVLDLARRVEGRMLAAGLTVVLTRGPGQLPSARDRADLAETVGADLVLSLHCDDAAPRTRPQGVSTASWGAGDTRSAEGARLAGLVQRELVARTDLVDCRTHVQDDDLLRLTRVASVHVSLGYLSSPSDVRRLREPVFLDACAEALVAGVQRFFLTADQDVATGTLSIVPAPAGG